MAALHVFNLRTWRSDPMAAGFDGDELDALDRRVRMSADLKEGLAARLERRAPAFRGE